MTADHFNQTPAAFKALRALRPFTVAPGNSRRFEVDHDDALVFLTG